MSNDKTFNYKGRKIVIKKKPRIYFEGYGENGSTVGYEYYINSHYISEEPTQQEALKEAKKYIDR